MTASNSTSNKKKSMINFEKARLILVDKTLSYVELNSPDDFATRCLLCNKTNDHDHDIIGKMKFEPKHKSYLVSLVEKKKIQGSTHTSKSGSLDIIPVNNKKAAASTPAEKRLENSDTNENLIQNGEGNDTKEQNGQSGDTNEGLSEPVSEDEIITDMSQLNNGYDSAAAVASGIRKSIPDIPETIAE